MINEEAFISGVEGDLGTIERDEEGLVSRINLYVPGHGVSGNEFQLSSFKSVWSQLSRLPSYARHQSKLYSVSSMLFKKYNKEEIDEYMENFTIMSEDESDVSDTENEWASEEIPGSWGQHALEKNPWEDTEYPVVKFINYSHLNLTEEEKHGVLTDRIISSGSTYLVRSPETGEFVLAKVCLHYKNLKYIDILRYYHYIQYLDLAGNELEDISSLSELPFLMYLDVASNKLTTVLNFKAPFFLTYADFSNNLIQDIRDLSDFWSLVYLDLSGNLIWEICGLQNLKYLRHLNISHNEIKVIENLSNLNILTLNLEQNAIRDFERGKDLGFKTLNHIVDINLSGNYLSTLQLFEDCFNLQSLDMQSNHIYSLYELNYLKNLHYLTKLDLSNNPITSVDNYMNVTLTLLKKLLFLDGEIIDPDMKVQAWSIYTPSLKLQQAELNSSLFFINQLNSPSISACFLPFDQPSPKLIVIAGPPGSEKKKLAKALINCYPDRLKPIISHTTSLCVDEKIDGETYYFVTVDDFSQKLRDGQFLTVYELAGSLFGLAASELDKALGQNIALVTHMDMSGALTLRAKGLKPYIILALASGKEAYKEMLERKYCYTPDQEFTYLRMWPSQVKTLAEEVKVRAKGQMMDVIQDTLDSIIDELVERCEVKKNSIINMDKIWTKEIGSLTRTSLEPDNFCTFMTCPDVTGLSQTVTKTAPEREEETEVVVENSKSIIDSQKSETSEIRERPLSRSVTFQDEGVESYGIGYSISTSIIPDSNMPSDIYQPLSVLSTAGKMIRAHSHPEQIGKSSTSHNKVEAPIDDNFPYSINDFIDDMVKARQECIRFHEENPGIFIDTVYTDDVDNALKKLKKIVRYCFEHPFKTQTFEYKNDPLYNQFIEKKLKVIQSQLYPSIDDCIPKKAIA